MPMQPWFRDAKLGIFIHYGIYAVKGVPESWSLYDGLLTREQYLEQITGFTAARYDPNAWAQLFARAGARYAVLTARHHDGFALWDSGLGQYSVLGSPAGRDLLGPYAEALRGRGLKVGLYYSHSDWTHPDYPTIRSTGRLAHVNDHRLVAPPEGEEDEAAWVRYLDYRDGQVAELLRRYHPDLLWFDGEWERSEQQWRMHQLSDLILTANPEIVLNGRMMSFGDYSTPEQGVPITPPTGPWELCLTINNSWGYQTDDHNQKSVRQLVRYFAETIGAGGNLLLDVGPMADGSITAEQTERLEQLGAWIARHSEAIYGTVAGLPAGHHYGPSTLSGDRRTLYLYCFDTPRETIGVRGLKTRIKRATVLGSGAELPHRVDPGLGDAPGLLWIDAPAPSDVDENATVVALELDGELDVYRGTGRE